MRKRFFRSIFIFLFFCINLKISYAGESPDNLFQDSEQKQLQWCFLYSNLFGFDINYISNPRLFQSIAEWLGTPYKYSGTSKNGVDCSGLICMIFHDSYDKKMEGCAGDLYKSSEQIKRSDLREGDLVFFKINRKRVSHVGIYIGENRFVHASSKNGVIISRLDDPYYNRYFYKAGRIKNN